MKILLSVILFPFLCGAVFAESAPKSTDIQKGAVWECNGEYAVQQNFNLYYSDSGLPVSGICKSLSKFVNGESKSFVSVEVKDGKFHGKRQTYFFDGSVSSESTYENGLLTGPIVVYDTNGKIEKTAVIEYTDDGLLQKATVFDEFGKVVRTTVREYENGIHRRTIAYNGEGELVMDAEVPQK
jgi:antitoxin component YwqK of YwqJK toxin-antitoxin module